MAEARGLRSHFGHHQSRVVERHWIRPALPRDESPWVCRRLGLGNLPGWGGRVDTVVLFEQLAAAVSAELMVGVGENLSVNRSIAKLVRDGHP